MQQMGFAGASLKLSILNPKGRVWTMVAGGGASVIYADTVGDLGFAEELGNYAEYSGAPNTQVGKPPSCMRWRISSVFPSNVIGQCNFEGSTFPERSKGSECPPQYVANQASSNAKQ